MRGRPSAAHRADHRSRWLIARRREITVGRETPARAAMFGVAHPVRCQQPDPHPLRRPGPPTSPVAFYCRPISRLRLVRAADIVHSSLASRSANTGMPTKLERRHRPKPGHRTASSSLRLWSHRLSLRKRWSQSANRIQQQGSLSLFVNRYLVAKLALDVPPGKTWVARQTTIRPDTVKCGFDNYVSDLHPE